MTAKRAAKLRLPPGLSPEEEARWWDAHPEYWDQRGSDSADEVIRPGDAPSVRRTRPINLRLPVDLIDALKREASRRDLPYQTLIRIWLREQLEPSAARPDHPSRVAENKAGYKTRKR